MTAIADTPTTLDDENDSLSSLAVYIPLRDVAATLKSGRANKHGHRNKHLHVATVYRWASANGCRGRVLRTVLCGSVRCTTLGWLDEFFAELTAASARPAQAAPPAVTRSPATRARAVAKATADLARMGISQS